MDIQAILVFILALLTLNLVVVGVYVVLVLKELRVTIKKANGIIESVEGFSSILSNPLSLLSGLFGAAMDGYKAVKEVRSIRSLKD
jgi:hypothetical protein